MKISYSREQAFDRLSTFGLPIAREGPICAKASATSRLVVESASRSLVDAFDSGAESHLLDLLHGTDLPLNVMWSVLLRAARDSRDKARVKEKSFAPPELTVQLARQVSPAILVLAADTVDIANWAFAPRRDEPVNGINLGVVMWAGVQRLRAVSEPNRNYVARIALPTLKRMAIDELTLVDGRNAYGLAFDLDKQGVLDAGVANAVSGVKNSLLALQDSA